MWKMGFLASATVLLVAVGCGDDGASENGTPTALTAPPATATQQQTGAEVPQEIVDAIDAYIRNVGLDGGTDGRPLVTDCAAVGAQLALCIDVSFSTISDGQATILVVANQSDAFWELTLGREDGEWTVTGVKSGGP